MGDIDMRKSLLTGLGSAFSLAAFVAASPAHASLIADGITYTLTETMTANPLVNQFTLGISGINGASDTEGGRYGVQSFAFNPPSNFVTAGPPTGFTYMPGGLNAGGCNGAGNFFCFSASTTPSGPALAANSILSFVFTETISSGSFAGYDPDFKINWDGTKNNYDLVSLPLAPTPGSSSVPEPGTFALFGAGLLAFGWLGRRSRA
jgi:hypothetical protein